MPLLELILPYFAIALIVYVWLLTPIPHTLRDKVVMVIFIKDYSPKVRERMIQLADKLVCDKCNAFWWSVLYSIFTIPLHEWYLIPIFGGITIVFVKALFRI